jgi:importin-7
LKQEQPVLYDTLAKNLNKDEQDVVEAAIHQADEIARNAALLANPANGHGQPQQ